jgi:predicted nucleic acid-binding protein
LFGRGITAEDAAMILVDTSVVVAWLDRDHDHHRTCTDALDRASQADELGISTVTCAELASGARTREHVDEQLSIFRRVPLDAILNAVEIMTLLLTPLGLAVRGMSRDLPLFYRH